MEKKQTPVDFLSDKEKDMIRAFNENTKLKDLLNRFLLDGVITQGVLTDTEGYDRNRNWAFGIVNDASLSTEAKGEKLELIGQATSMVLQAFHYFDLVTPEKEEKEDKKNPAV